MGGGSKGDGGKQDAINASNAAAAKAREEFSNIELPTIGSQELQLESPELVGLLEDQKLRDSALAGISTDPALKEAQYKALRALEERGREGLTTEDKQMIMQMQQKAAGARQAQDSSVMQSMQERGMGGSGQELIQRLMSSQNAANMQQTAGMDIAAQSVAAKRQAIAGAGQMAGQMSQDEYNRAANTASARDAIEKMNTQMKVDTAAKNLGLRQQYSDAATNIKNQQQQYNKELIQKQYENQMNLASSKAGVYAGQSQNLMNQAGMAQAGKGGNKIGAGLAGAGSGAAAGTAISPGWGTAIGAGVGFMGGMMSADGGIINSRDSARYADGGAVNTGTAGNMKETYSDDIQPMYAEGGIAEKDLGLFRRILGAVNEYNTSGSTKDVKVVAENGFDGNYNNYVDESTIAATNDFNKKNPKYEPDLQAEWNAGEKAAAQNQLQSEWNAGELAAQANKSKEDAVQLNAITSALSSAGKLFSPKEEEVEKTHRISPVSFGLTGAFAPIKGKFAEGGIAEADVGKFRSNNNVSNEFSSSSSVVNSDNGIWGNLSSEEKEYLNKKMDFENTKNCPQYDTNNWTPGFANGGTPDKKVKQSFTRADFPDRSTLDAERGNNAKQIKALTEMKAAGNSTAAAALPGKLEKAALLDKIYATFAKGSKFAIPAAVLGGAARIALGPEVAIAGEALGAEDVGAGSDITQGEPTVQQQEMLRKEIEASPLPQGPQLNKFDKGGILEKLKKFDEENKNRNWEKEREDSRMVIPTYRSGESETEEDKNKRYEEDYARFTENNPKNFEKGGVQEEGPYVGDRVDAKINNGEMVLNLDQQQRLMDLLRGHERPAEMPDKDIVEPADQEDTNLHEKNKELKARVLALEGLLRK